MAVLSVPYSTEVFHKALSIHSAGAAFRKRNADAFISGTLEPIIREHDMEALFGIGLIHRHFDLEAEEILVEFNNISTPWACEPGLTTSDAGFNSLIYPVAWMLKESANHDGGETRKWMPYEFAFSPVAGKDSFVVNLDNSPAKQAFLEAFTTALTEGGFQDILGLRAWPGEGFGGTLEFTQGRANINLKEGQYEIVKGGSVGYTDTMWFYEPTFLARRCRCICQYGRNGFHTMAHYNNCLAKGDRHAVTK
jgi:hypothetical protein